MNETFVVMARDCLGFARDGSMLEEYKLFCRRASGVGTSYYDRMRAADTLLESRFIEIQDGRLSLPIDPKMDWLLDDLVNGDSNAWGLARFHPQLFAKYEIINNNLSEIGYRGEIAVVELLNELLPLQMRSYINHVAVYDDSAGYDIFSPSTRIVDSGFLLEVKTTTRPGDQMTIFLSRHEFDVALANRNWRLVVVRIINKLAVVQGHVSISEFTRFMPIETSANCEWMSVKVTLSVDLLTPGLP